MSHPGRHRKQSQYVGDLLRASAFVRRLVWTVMGVVFILLIAACVSLLFQVDQNTHATQSALTSGRRTARLEARLEAVAVGECYRVDYLRWQEDVWRYDSWQRDAAAAHFLARVSAPSVRTLAVVFRRAADSDRFLPYTDCTRATSTPLVYSPPTAIAFGEFTRAMIVRILRHPRFFSGPAPPMLRPRIPPRTPPVIYGGRH